MELTGSICDISRDFSTGKPKITFLLDRNLTVDELPKERLSLKITKFRKKRSRNANAYMWELVGKLSEKIGETPNDIYRGYIKACGVFRDFPGLTEDNAATLKHMWEDAGIGWITESESDGERVTVRCHYGSSSYNTKQMARLIDMVVEDCKDFGIETATPEELTRMKEEWVCSIKNLHK